MYIPLTFEGALQKCLYASGGVEGFFVSGSQQWKYHWFTSSANLVVDKGAINDARIFVVGGAGGGATGLLNTTAAGGGGGGGLTYTTNAILYKGTYTITVGRGGTGGSGSLSAGSSGSSSSFIGQNINLFASGGFGGTFGAGTTGGTSGNGFSGGLTSFTCGGGGGGAFGTGSNATSTKAGNGGIGLSLQVAEPVNNPTDNWSFGCGGGGYAANSANQAGVSCNGVTYGDGGRGLGQGSDGADYYGMGGGAGETFGGKGGSGSVIIQYPISTYCANYFNKTGSCGCSQVTFDTSDPIDFYPTETGSYLYMPCGTSTFVSGTLYTYAPITVCAVSNSYYAYSYQYGTNGAGFATSSIKCGTDIIGFPATCTTESFNPTCTSSVVTIYTPSASFANVNTFDYVAKNAATRSTYTTTTDRVKYLCISSGSAVNNLSYYPQVLGGNFISLYNTASCNTIRINSPGTGRGRIYLCDGSNQTLINPAPNTTYCIDMIFGVRPVSGFSVFNYSILGTCLSGSFDTGSCGCP